MKRVFLFLLLLTLARGNGEEEALRGKPGAAYNLGVYHYSRGEYPQAIFWWRLSWIRGQERAGTLINSLKRRLGIREGSLFRRAHPDLPAALLLLVLLAFLAYNGYLLYRRSRPALMAEALFLAAAAALFLLTLRERSYYLNPPLCVVGERGRIYSAPSPNLPVEELLPGEELRCLETRPSWVKVETPWGTVGWVRRKGLIMLR